MSNNKQSSVDYLINELNRIQELYYGQSIIPIEVITKAKAMHKEEIEEAFANGVYDEYEYHINNEPRKNTEQYYSETFGGNK